MKFRELPEGYYFVHAVADVVYVERLENPDTAPPYLTETYATTKVVHDGREYRKNGQPIGEMGVEFKTFEEMRTMRKSRGASYGHITRRILAKEPLTGKTLELALDLVTPDTQGKDNKFAELCNSIAKKLDAGQPLDEYETHMMVDVLLVHARLG